MRLIGNFGQFGPCVMKVVRLGNTTESFDLTENLIHANHSASLIFTVHGQRNFVSRDIEEDRMSLDFRFYEVCTVTVFTKFEIQDNYFREQYYLNTREALKVTEILSIYFNLSIAPAAGNIPNWVGRYPCAA